MLRSMLQSRRDAGRSHAFSLVEILIVILIIAVLLAVALPQLLGSRDSGLDSAAKQQLKNALTEVTAYTLRTETSPADAAAVQLVAPTLKFVANTLPGDKDPNSNARQISYLKKGTAGFVIAVAGAQTNCWAIRVSVSNTEYLGAKTLSSCTADAADAASGWQGFGFPTEAK
jgi:prepilin-type N-terminal cleavage/methylation domain-containing protein